MIGAPVAALARSLRGRDIRRPVFGDMPHGMEWDAMRCDGDQMCICI
jgi:hypothetical protein